MTFRAKLDDAESRAFWDSIRRGAQECDAMPAWQKGVLGEPARIVVEVPTCEGQEPSLEPPEVFEA